MENAPGSYANTVYSPDVMMSGLAQRIDRFIQGRTGLVIAGRDYRVHSAQTITRFYALTGSTDGSHWPLVVDLFDGRSVCVSRWVGRRPLEALKAIKGTAQPATAPATSIRANFWCDNPVTNLVHVSDDYDVMRIEERILRSLPAADPWPGGPANDASPPWQQLRHNALLTFAKALKGSLPGLVDRMPVLPSTGSAAETTRLMVDVLERCAVEFPVSAPVIEAFLTGDRVAVDRFVRRAAVGEWDALVIRCGLHAMPAWRRRFAESDPAAAVQESR